MMKSGKPQHKVTSIRSISLLPVISKIDEKLLLKRFKPIIEERNLSTKYHLGFRKKYSIIDQIQSRTTNIIGKSVSPSNWRWRRLLSNYGIRNFNYLPESMAHCLICI